MALFTWLLLALAVLDPAHGQQTAAKVASPEDQQAFPLRAILIEGNHNFTSEEIIALTGLEIGQLVQSDDFHRALEEINRSGGFNSLEFRYEPLDDGYQVIFTVVEVPDLYAVRFTGFGVPEEQITDLLREKVPLFGPKVPPTGPIIDRIGNELQAFWKGLGNDTDVIGSLLPTKAGDFEMLFRPEGTIKTISFTKFENAEVISVLELQRVFHGVAAGEPYSEERLEELLSYNIAPLYEEKGRLEVKFCPCRTEPDPDTEGLIVTIPVEEGPAYTFGDVQLPEAGEADKDALERLVKFKSGDTANMSRVRDTVHAIENLFRANGYMNATVEFEKELDTEKKTVDVTIQSEPGERYTFNTLTIKGLDLIGEAAVRKRWGLNLGDPFNAAYPALFLNRVREDGMFDNLSDTGWSIKVNENDKTADVELTFK